MLRVPRANEQVMDLRAIERLFNERGFKRMMESNIAHILCRTGKRTSFVLTSKTSEIYTNGSKIVVGLPQEYEGRTYGEIYSMVKACVGHESAHVKWSNFDSIKDYLQEVNNRGIGTSLGHSMFNIIEDGRIERLLCEELPGYIKHIQFLNSFLIKKDGTLNDREHVLGNIIGVIHFLAVLGVYPTNYMDLLEEKERDLIESKIHPLVLKGVMTNSYKVAQDVCLEILDLIKDYIPEPQAMPQELIDLLEALAQETYQSSEGQDGEDNRDLDDLVNAIMQSLQGQRSQSGNSSSSNSSQDNDKEEQNGQNSSSSSASDNKNDKESSESEQGSSSKGNKGEESEEKNTSSNKNGQPSETNELPESNEENNGTSSDSKGTNQKEEDSDGLGDKNDEMQDDSNNASSGGDSNQETSSGDEGNSGKENESEQECEGSSGSGDTSENDEDRESDSNGNNNNGESEGDSSNDKSSDEEASGEEGDNESQNNQSNEGDESQSDDGNLGENDSERSQNTDKQGSQESDSESDSNDQRELSELLPAHFKDSNADSSSFSYEKSEKDFYENLKEEIEEEAQRAFEKAEKQEQRERQNETNAFHEGINLNEINSCYSSDRQEPDFEFIYPDYPFAKPQAEFRTKIHGLKKTFEKVLKNQETHYKGQKRGRLDTARLWRLGVNDTSVFKKKNVVEKSDYSVEILIDASGSMWDRAKYKNALGTAICIEAALVDLEGVEVKTVAFNFDNGTRMLVLKDFKDKESKTPSAYERDITDGCNRDGFAIRVALNDLNKRNSKNKLLIVISDGMPNARPIETSHESIADVKDAVHKGRKDTTVVSILINDGPIGSSTKEVFQHMYEEKGSIMVDVYNEPENLMKNIVLYLKKLFRN